MKGIVLHPPELKVALYRIAQEALNNVAKHSGATQATCDLHCQPDKIELIIRDNGKGFNMNTQLTEQPGTGNYAGAGQRASSATVNIESQPDQGTTVTVIWKNNQREDQNDRISTN